MESPVTAPCPPRAPGVPTTQRPCRREGGFPPGPPRRREVAEKSQFSSHLATGNELAQLQPCVGQRQKGMAGKMQTWEAGVNA